MNAQRTRPAPGSNHRMAAYAGGGHRERLPRGDAVQVVPDEPGLERHEPGDAHRRDQQQGIPPSASAPEPGALAPQDAGEEEGADGHIGRELELIPGDGHRARIP